MADEQPRPVQNGDVFTSAEGFTIVVRRTARDLSWADIKVVQPNGATWTKRQSLRNGQLPYAAERVPAGQDGGDRG